METPISDMLSSYGRTIGDTLNIEKRNGLYKTAWGDKSEIGLYETVKTLMGMFSVPKVEHHEKKTDKSAEAMAYRESGYTYNQIAKIMGISIGRAHQLCNPKNIMVVPLKGSN